MFIVICIVFFVMAGWFCLATIFELRRSRNRFMQNEWASNNVVKARDMLVNDVLAAEKSIYILSGSADMEIYDNSRVLDAFEKVAKDSKVEIKILFSETKRSTRKLRQLADGRENFDIIPSDIIPKTHFRIVDSQCVYMEKPHSDDIDGPREFRYIKNDPLAGHMFEEKFKELMSAH